MFSLAFIRDLVIDSIGLGEGEKSEEGLELIVIVIVIAIASARAQREKRMQYSNHFQRTAASERVYVQVMRLPG